MALSIKDEETDALVRRLAEVKGISYTAAVRLAVSNELTKSDIKKKNPAKILDRIVKLKKEISAFPILDHRTPEDIVGYDKNGLPN